MISDIIIVALVLLFTLIGVLRGFLRTLCNLAATIVSALVANWLSAPIGTWFYTTVVRPTILTNIEHEITQSGFSAALANSMKALPDWLSSMVSSVFAPLGISMEDLQRGVLISDSQAQQIARTIEEPIGRMITVLFAVVAAVILFFVVLLILKLILGAVIRTVRSNPASPGGLDRFFGGLFGFAEGILIVIAVIHIVYLVLSLSNPAVCDDPKYFGTLFNALCLFR